MFVVCALLLVAASAPASAAVTRSPRAERCCEYAGCFNNNPPLDHLEVPACPEDLDITYALYTRNNRDTPETVSRTEIGPSYSGSRRTVFITHGWNGDTEKLWIHDMKNNLLNNFDYNVILLDWRNGAGNIWYPQAAANTRSAGAETALVIRHLVNNGGASFSNMYCMGHSLGGHVCGHTGKRTDSKIGRITGFDPAGPLFETFDVSGRVDKGDASFVDVIHTATEGFETIDLGVDKPIGHVDFYPNNGRCQPGCDDCSPSGQENTPYIGACSHGRPMAYFNEALSSGCPFTSYPCASKDDATNGNCNSCNGNCQTMSIDSENNPGRGTFYLQTNPEPPYCQG